MLSKYPIRYRELTSVLNANKFMGTYLAWFKETQLDNYKLVMTAALMTEAYELLKIAISRIEHVSEKYEIWYKFHEMPVILEKKTIYTRVEYETISEVTGIPLHEFEEVIQLRTGNPAPREEGGN